MTATAVTSGVRERGPFVALLGANAISVTGSMMTLLAVPWFVLETSGSAARAGLSAFCEGVAFAGSSALGGLAVDRLGARRASVASDLVAAAAIGALPALHLTVGLAFWQLLVLVSIAALVRAPGETARIVLVPDLVRRAGTTLERSTSAWDGVSRGGRMVGAPLAGVLIGLIGPPQVLLVDAATFVASAVLVRLFVPALPLAARVAGTHWITELREGIAYLGTDRLLRAVVIMVMITNCLDAAIGSVLTPVYAKEVLGSSVALGLISGTLGGMALVGTIVYGTWAHRFPRRAVYTVAFLVVGAPRGLIMAGSHSLWPVLVVVGVAGLCAGALNPILGSVEYERIPPDLRGRVFGVMTAGGYGAMPLGALGAGWLVEAVGLRPTLVGVATIYLLVTLSPLVLPAWRQMDERRGLVPG